MSDIVHEFSTKAKIFATLSPAHRHGSPFLLRSELQCPYCFFGLPSSKFEFELIQFADTGIQDAAIKFLFLFILYGCIHFIAFFLALQEGQGRRKV